MSVSFAVCGFLRDLRDRRLELLELAKLPKLDRPLLARGTRVRRALRPLDRLGLGLHADEPVAADGLFRLRKRAVGHDALAAGDADARALFGRMQRRHVNQHTALA